MAKYVFGQEQTEELSESVSSFAPLLESNEDDKGWAMETAKPKAPKYNMKEGVAKPVAKPVVKKPLQEKKMKEFSESTPEYEQAVRYLIKDLVKNHGISRGASLDRILAMFQVFYSKAVEYGDTAGSKKVQRTLNKFL